MSPLPSTGLAGALARTSLRECDPSTAASPTTDSAPHKPKTSTAPLDTEAFPKILEAVLSFAPYESLLALRATSRSVRDRCDALIVKHIALGVRSGDPTKMPIVKDPNDFGYADLDHPDDETVAFSVFGSAYQRIPRKAWLAVPVREAVRVVDLCCPPSAASASFGGGGSHRAAELLECVEITLYRLPRVTLVRQWETNGVFNLSQAWDKPPPSIVFGSLLNSTSLEIPSTGASKTTAPVQLLSRRPPRHTALGRGFLRLPTPKTSAPLADLVASPLKIEMGFAHKLGLGKLNVNGKEAGAPVLNSLVDALDAYLRAGVPLTVVGLDLWTGSNSPRTLKGGLERLCAKIVQMRQQELEKGAAGALHNPFFPPPKNIDLEALVKTKVTFMTHQEYRASVGEAVYALGEWQPFPRLPALAK
jgi:hypothetical protein